MTGVLMYADTLRSPDLRHVVSLPIGDAFPYIEHEGKAYVFVSSVEEERVRALDGMEVVSHAELGLAELVEQRYSYRASRIELLVRACRLIGIAEAVVPDAFPLAAAERLRREGIGLRPDSDRFAERRRSKSPHELEGIRRAQAETQRAMGAIRDGVRAGATSAPRARARPHAAPLPMTA